MSKETDFQIGDIVECINNDDVERFLKIGKHYRVIGFNELSSGRTELYLNDTSIGSWMRSRFKYPNPPKTVTDHINTIRSLADKIPSFS